MRAQRPAVACRVLLGLVFAALLVVLRLPATAQGPGLVRIEVTIGKSHVVEVKEPFDRVSVTDPNIADVFVIKPNQILINGKALGVTSLVVFYAQKTQFFDLVAEVQRTALKELGFSYRFLGATFQGGAFPGAPFFPPLGLISDPNAPDLAFSTLASFFFPSPNRDSSGVLRSLAERRPPRTRTSPSLKTESGKRASFLS